MSIVRAKEIRLMLTELNHDWERSVEKFQKETSSLITRFETIATFSKELLEEYRELVGQELTKK